MAQNTFVAIDPMSMILSGAAYDAWIEKNHPRIPTVSEIREALQSIAPREQKASLNRAKTFVSYGKAVEEAMATMKK